MTKLTAEQVKKTASFTYILTEGVRYGVDLTPLLKKMMGHNYCPNPKEVTCTIYRDPLEFAKVQRRWYFATLEGDIKNADDQQWSALQKQTTAFVSEDGKSIHIAKYIPDLNKLKPMIDFWACFDRGENPVEQGRG